MSLDFKCRKQLQQTLHVFQFRQVRVSCNLLSFVIGQKFTCHIWEVSKARPINLISTMEVHKVSTLGPLGHLIHLCVYCT